MKRTAKNAISRKIDLFDFTSFFAWPFLKFLSLCGLLCYIQAIHMYFVILLQEVQDEEPLFSLKEYLSRLANSENRLYGNSYGSDLIMPDMLRDRRRSSAESNFQLRVRKRAPGPISESNFQLRVRKSPISESNFQLRVRKNILDRLRSMPQIRSAAEDNFQLR